MWLAKLIRKGIGCREGESFGSCWFHNEKGTRDQSYSVSPSLCLLVHPPLPLHRCSLRLVIHEANGRHHMKIQDHPQSFYETFDIVIAGLDSIPARRWMNATMVQIAQEGNIIPLIDGGTEGMLTISFAGCSSWCEGFKGQSRVILPTVNACYECTVRPAFWNWSGEGTEL